MLPETGGGLWVYCGYVCGGRVPIRYADYTVV